MPHLAQLLLLLAILLLAAKGAGSLSSRLGQPAVLGEILVGLILGPTVLNILGWRIFQASGAGGAAPPALAAVVHDLAQIGVVLLMFVAGMETDLAGMKRVGKVAFCSAAGGVVLPFVFGVLTGWLFGRSWLESIFIGTILTATSVSISAQTLMELGALRSREGSTILGAAVIDDVLGILILSLVVAFTGAGAHGEGAAGIGSVPLVCLRMALFMIGGWFLGRRFLDPIIERVRSLPASQALMAFVLLTAFVYSFAAEYLGRVAAITGAYMAGLLFAQTRFKEEIDRGIHPITYSLFVPIFFLDIGLQADAKGILRSPRMLLLCALVVGLAVVSKVVGCAVPAALLGFTRRESVRVGVGMISRGEVGLILAGYALAAGAIAHEIFSIMVVVVLVTTLITPLWLRRLFSKTVPPPLEGDRVLESIPRTEAD